MRRNKKERQQSLKGTIEKNPFVTDEELADLFSVSVQTIRLDRMELSIPELRERIKHVAEKNHSDEIKALPIEEVIGEIIDVQLDESAISIFDVKEEHVFVRNGIARGHHLFAQANSLAVAVMNENFTLTAKADIVFTQPVYTGDRVIAKAKVQKADPEKNRTKVEVESYVQQKLVFKGSFDMYRAPASDKAAATT